MKVILNLQIWPAGKEDFAKRLEAFESALQDHSQTVDVPRPTENPVIESAQTYGWTWEGKLLPEPVKKTAQK